MTDREGPIHRSILAYLRLALPHAIIIHPASETRRPGRAGDRERMMNRTMGVIPGIPDLIVFLHAKAGGALFFEVKAKGGCPSPAQRAMLDALDALGYRTAVVRSIDDTRAALSAWGIWAGGVER